MFETLLEGQQRANDVHPNVDWNTSIRFNWREEGKAISVMTQHGPPETVYVENEWYDGPRAAVGDVNGVPHRYVSLFDEDEDDYLDTFLIWPVDRHVLELEIEQWRIFGEWNALYESGRADLDSHPRHGGRNARWDEIEALLNSQR